MTFLVALNKDSKFLKDTKEELSGRRAQLSFQFYGWFYHTQAMIQHLLTSMNFGSGF